ncbi:hypothetical protein NE237_032728 [Protea cynaroides]|uniref:MADS-box domain-containing protein n=1 Tax=Protea cynaroides TaxID=273540 RepID=A0A9Q0L530_9MAGN|nr:hypothetical protein NE237_032728 [Protea cynaroides]
MARKKIKLALIANEAARRNTFNKRKRGIIKKMSELSTLCGIIACGIIYGPYVAQPDVWPSQLGAKEVLDMFKSLPQMEKFKKMVNHEEYLRQRISKLRDQLRRIQKENQKKEMTKLMQDCLTGNKDLHELSMVELTDLTNVVDDKIKAMQNRIDALKQIPPQIIGTSRNIVGAINLEDNKAVRMPMNAMQGQPWFMQGVTPTEQMPFYGEEVVLPYVDNGAWATSFFP